ncbi:MAG TPA: 4Fe-4S dicluster domain-containing protein [Planctomycetes bacterium]|nr:4Fe-4S dicluster domain-containing protein [Planctomycetota bacterium]HIJ69832.1 4Fe-4S dicluster domain-containing protein [Planctomycetota bacterium]
MPVISKIQIKNASITKTNLFKLLDLISQEKFLIAPAEGPDLEDINFLPVTGAEQICFDYENTLVPPKEYFFGQSECMFSFSPRSNESITVTDQSEELVFFGVRPCDVKAIELLDKFYERSFVDDYYLSKRACSVIISVACSQLNEECFCTSVGSGPVLTEGFDIQLIDAGNDFAVQVGSEKGLQLYEQYQDFFGAPIDVDAEKEFEKAKASEPGFDLQRVYDRLKSNKVDDRLWADIARRCQSCGLCLLLCPTCSCYTVIDRVTPNGRNLRMREWDCCYFEGFTRMAGGQNPVKPKEEMIKRKYYHKLVQQIDEFGMSGCTGCGRCNTVCVGNVNWLENIRKIEGSGRDV